ncbi:hypothetical protein [Gordonia sp. NPDC003950]
MARVVPDIGDAEFSADLLVDFDLRKPKLTFVLPKVEYVPPSGADAWDAWLAERMIPQPAIGDDGQPVLNADGTAVSETRKPISDREFYSKQIEVVVDSLATEYPSVVSKMAARKVIDRIASLSLGQVKWIYDEWVAASETSMGESEGSATSSKESTAGPSDTTS